MNSEQLFKVALGIDRPWEVIGGEFKVVDGEEAKELHIDIDFKRGSKFLDQSGELCSIYDTKQKIWRHLNFFQHSCYLHSCRSKRGRVEALLS